MDNIGTVIVSKSAVKEACEKALKNISIVNYKAEILRLIKFRRYLNLGTFWEKLFRKDPKRKYYSLKSVREKLREIIDSSEMWIGSRYRYRVHFWEETKDNAKQLLRCCESDIMEPLTIEIDAWDDIVWLANLSKEMIGDYVKKESIMFWEDQ